MSDNNDGDLMKRGGEHAEKTMNGSLSSYLANVRRNNAQY